MKRHRGKKDTLDHVSIHNQPTNPSNHRLLQVVGQFMVDGTDPNPGRVSSSGPNTWDPLGDDRVGPNRRYLSPSRYPTTPI